MIRRASRIRFPINCWLVERQTGKTVAGQIGPTTKRDLLGWVQWRYRADDEDKTWDWWGIYLQSQGPENRYECYSLITSGTLEGLMVLDLKLHKTASGEAIVVDYLATNPKDRMKDNGLKYVGLALLSTAIKRSMECGAQGAVWLESLPGAGSFYASLGMKPQPAKSSEGNLIYVLGAALAKQLLEEIRDRGIITI
jgi:hypothetical protein